MFKPSLQYLLYIAIVGLLAATTAIGCSPTDTRGGTPVGEASQPLGAYASYDSLYSLGEGKSLLDLNKEASRAIVRQDIDGAMSWLRVALARPLSRVAHSDSFEYAVILSNLGYMWLGEKYNPDQAHPLLMQALGMLPGADSAGILTGTVYDNLGQLYLYYHDVPKALDYYRRGFKAATDQALKSRDRKLRELAHTGLNYIFVDMVQTAWLHDFLDDVSGEWQRYSRLSPHHGQLRAYAETIMRASRRYRDGDHATAALMLTRAGDSLGTLPNFRRFDIINTLLAAKVLLDERPGECLSVLEREEDKILGSQFWDLIDHYYAIRARCYRAIGNTAQAEKYEFSALKLRDSLFNAQKYGAMRDNESAWKASQFDASLRQERQAKEAEHRENVRQRQMMLVISTAALIITLLLAYAINRNRQLNAANRELYRKAMAGITPKEGSLTDPDGRATHDPFEGTGKDAEPGEAERPDDYDTLEEIYRSLQQFMEHSSAACDPEFSVTSCSQATGFLRRQISRAINTVGRKNFNTFVAEYRIRWACERLMAPRQKRPTIEAVAEEVGYRSRSHFSKTFKTVTGLTVSDFIKQSEQPHR